MGSVKKANSAENMLRQILGRIGDLSAAIDQQGSSVSRGTAPQFSTCKKKFLDRPKNWRRNLARSKSVLIPWICISLDGMVSGLVILKTGS